MTADEIRQKHVDYGTVLKQAPSLEDVDHLLKGAVLETLLEIAAQMAELNETIRDQSLRVQIEPGQEPIVTLGGAI